MNESIFVVLIIPRQKAPLSVLGFTQEPKKLFQLCPYFGHFNFLFDKLQDSNNYGSLKLDPAINYSKEWQEKASRHNSGWIHFQQKSNNSVQFALSVGRLKSFFLVFMIEGAMTSVS